MFYQSARQQSAISLGTESRRLHRVETEPMKSSKIKAFRISTDHTTVRSQAEDKAYQTDLSFYQFLKEQTIKTCQEPQRVSTYKAQVLPAKYVKEKIQFRGYLQTSQQRFRGEPLVAGVVKQDKIEDYLQSKQEKSKKLKQQTHRVQLRNNQLMYEQQQENIKKATFKNFKRGEQIYFDQLKKLQTDGQKNFLNKAQLRQVNFVFLVSEKYYFDNLIPPQQQFVNAKDLYLSKTPMVEVQPDKIQWTMNDAQGIESRLKDMTDHNQQFRQLLQSIKRKDLEEKRSQSNQ